MADSKIKVNELQTATPELTDTLLASGADKEYACRISDLKDVIGGGGGGGLNNAKDASNGGIIEGLINGNDGEVNIASGQNAHVEGGYRGEYEEEGQTQVYYEFNTASGDASHAEGSMTTASEDYAHAEGYGTTACAWNTHAEGLNTTASGNNSHSEGQENTASGISSHAEGYNVTASGDGSHAEGTSTIASGNYAHAEGGGATASGENSHAEGQNTTANHAAQHVFGQYNIADPSNAAASSRGTYIEIVGNGINNSNRSNARTLDWNGNEEIAGTFLSKGGIILQSPDGSRFTLTVGNDGTLTATKIV